jgi:microcystin degradation protein MlrC
MIDALMRHPEIPPPSARMWDPVAVSFCRAAGPGAQIPLRFCGKAAPSSGHPIDAEVVVRATPTIW